MAMLGTNLCTTDPSVISGSASCQVCQTTTVVDGTSWKHATGRFKLNMRVIMKTGGGLPRTKYSL